MLRRVISGFLVVLLLGLLWYINKPRPKDELWPKIEPFETSYLQVSDLHEMYYELCGKREGIPVFVLHGGPGGHVSPYYRRFFDPEKYLMVLYDQRGAGKSKPHAELKENTTWHLVEDIEKLRTHLELDKILLFGGSWGSTLALAYAETYPENVSGMILRGVFTAAKDEIDHFYHGGVRPFFPELWEDFIAEIPDEDKSDLPNKLFYLVSSDEPHLQDKFTRLWIKYEYKLASLNTPQHLVDEMDHVDIEEIYPFSLIENFYMQNNCFFEENQLLNNAYLIKDIPTIMVTGRYDMICPPVNAWRLHQKLNQSELIIAEEAGHWMGDKPVEKALLNVSDWFEDHLSSKNH